MAKNANYPNLLMKTSTSESCFLHAARKSDPPQKIAIVEAFFRIDYLCNEMGFDVQEVIADRRYGRGPTYSSFRQRKIRTYIPLHDARLGNGKLTPTTFKYHGQTDRYQCPEGYFLYPYEKLDNGLIKRYRIMGGHCPMCPRRNYCLPESAKSRARFVYRSPHQ